MQILTNRKSWLTVVAVIIIFVAMTAFAGGHEKPQEIRGSILINITYFGYKFVEFKLQDGRLLKTFEGKVIPGNREQNIPRTDCSDDFKRIYWPERLYYPEMEENLKSIFSQYDLEALDNLLSQYKQNAGKLEKERHFLTGPGRQFKYFSNKYANYFIPNKQFSYAIYSRRYLGGVLINLNSKEILFPFGLDLLDKIVWNKEGRYLAYSTLIDRDMSQSILVIQDINKGRTLLSKSIGKSVANITWSPDSSAVALLTYTTRKSTSLGDSIAAAVGHPYPVNTFFLEVYDISGNRLYNEQVDGSFKSSKGRLVWINPADK